MGVLSDEDVGAPQSAAHDAPSEDDAGDDTTSAEAGPPTARPSDADIDDRTMQANPQPPSASRQPASNLAPPTSSARFPVSSAVPTTASRPPPLPPRRPPALTALGLGPGSPPSIAPSTLPSSSPPPPPQASEAPSDVTEDAVSTEDERPPGAASDEEDDSITTMAPRPSASFLGSLAAPRTLPIIDRDDYLDETEVRTQVSLDPRVALAAEIALASRPKTSPRPAAGVPASAALPSTTAYEHVDEDEDNVTTQARLPRIDLDGYANDGDDSETVTARARALSATYEEDSVTTQAPAVSEELMAAVVAPLTKKSPPSAPKMLGKTLASPGNGPSAARTLDSPGNGLDALTALRVDSVVTGVQALDDTTEGTTKKLSGPPESPADGESESITTEAPAPLTNMLRVIAADASLAAEPPPPPAAGDDGDEPENRTAVMASAPLQRAAAELVAERTPGALPSIRPTGPRLMLPQTGSGGFAAAGTAVARVAALSPSSQSGLRVTQPARDAHPSGVGRTVPPKSQSHDPRAFATTEAFNGAVHTTPTVVRQPSVHDVDLGKGPRYGLLVTIVGIVSLVVPATLFIALRGRGDEPVTTGTPSSAASDFDTHDLIPRGKIDRKTQAALAASAAAAASASAAASSSAAPSSTPSSKKPPPPRPFPVRRP